MPFGDQSDSDDPSLVAADRALKAETLFVSVIMPVRNESRHIRQTMDGLLRQCYPLDLVEILVVDGESTDGTSAIVSEYAANDTRIKLLSNPSRLSSAARNIGIKAARGDVVVIVDGHCQFATTDYFQQLSRAFAQSQADCLGRPQTLNVEHGSPLQRAIAVARASRLGHNPGSFIYSEAESYVPAQSVGVAYRRSVFDSMGYFDESFDACEDVDFNHRLDNAGLRCWLTPAIKLRYHPRGTMLGLLRQLARYGTGRVRLARKHPDTVSLLTFAPAAFLTFVLVGALGSLLWPSFGVFYAGVLLSYVAVVLGFSLLLAVRSGNAVGVWYLPAVFVCIHAGAGYGELREAIRGLSLPLSRKPTNAQDSPSSPHVTDHANERGVRTP